MPKYELHAIRKDILARAAYDEQVVQHLRPMLVVLECLDWNKKEKTMMGKPHLNNWLKSIGDPYGCTLVEMYNGVQLMRALELMELTQDQKGQYTLSVADIPTDEVF